MPPVTGIQYLRCLRENGRARSFDTAFVYHTRLAAAARRSRLVEQLRDRRAAHRARDPAIDPANIDREQPAHAAPGELGGLAPGIAEPLRTDDLERELLDLPAPGHRVRRSGVHADVGGDIVDLRRPGQKIRSALELRPRVGLDQR